MLKKHDKFIAALNSPKQDLLNIVLNYPEYKEEVIELLKQPGKFVSLVNSRAFFSNLANKFSEKNYKDELFRLFKETDSLSRLVKNLQDLGTIMVEFKDHRDDFVEMLSLNKNFHSIIKNKQDIKILAFYFKHLKYTNDSIFEKDRPEDVLQEMIKITKSPKAYTAGAAAGALASANQSLPYDIGKIIGGFFDRRTGGRLAQTSKAAAEMAKIEKDNDHKPLIM
ncbi:hypothetical protein [uncultured Legionella sp.]|uniref:hypothetical protein n=1 Tax=uncultured Legionella sp. TaxID=210934 RepID=UPI002628DD6F|nr:hypothetical protein [uncultured Legionella sp.]